MEKKVREALSGDERKAWRKVEAFEEENPSQASAVLKLATAPLQSMLPDAVTDKMHSALESLVEIVQRTDDWGSAPEVVLQGTPYDTLDKLHDRGTITDVFALIERQTKPAVLKATLQGAGLGFGGIMLAAADVPLLLISHLRLLTRMGLCCGYDLKSPGERDFLLSLLKLCYSLSDWQEKKDSVRELWGMIQKKAEAREPEGEIARAVLFKSIGAFADKIGPILLRRRAGSLVPLLGSAFGAGSNYLLTQDVAKAGQHTLVKRFLTDRVVRKRK